MYKKSKAHRTGATPKRAIPPLVLIGGIALVAIVILALVWFGLAPNRGSGGIPQLQVSAERLELGKQIFNQPVRASFDIKNTGTGTLVLQVPRSPKVLEGC